MLNAAFDFSGTLKLLWCLVQQVDEALAEAGDGFNYEGFNDMASQFNTLISTMAIEQKHLGRIVNVVDGNTWVVPATHLGADGVHWATAGATEMGNRVYKALSA